MARSKSSRLSLSDLASHVSPGTARLNPHLFNSSGKPSGPVLRPLDVVGQPLPQHDPQPALRRSHPRKAKDGVSVGKRPDSSRCSPVSVSRRPVVLITSYRAGTPLDDDNLRGGLKALRDLIARHLHIDDADHLVEWRYAQARVTSRDHQGTSVLIMGFHPPQPSLINHPPIRQGASK